MTNLANYSLEIDNEKPGLSDFLKAQEDLKGIVENTNLIYSRFFSSEYHNRIYIKPENLQVTGAFKIRGAYYKLNKLTEQEKQKGLIASSAGNHAQGVAYAAHKLGIGATIVMPKTTPLIKVEATKKYGVNVVLYGECYDDAFEKAKSLQKEKDYTFIHPFNDIDVITGQGTIALEIIQQLSEVDYIIVPIGGGGLISGIAMAAKILKPDIKIIGVEPEGANSMKASLAMNKIINLEKVTTIAEGVAVKRPGDITFPIIKNYVDDIITVSDFELMEAFLLLLEKDKLIGENAGVLSLAALKKIKEANKNIACVVSGGNIDVLTISSMISRGLVSRGRIFCFSVELPDIPGQLLSISEILAKMNGNVIKLEHNQFKTLDRFMQVQLEVTVETNGHNHVKEIISELNKAGYNVVQVV
ncbi:MAG: threonine dehydratase [Clostridiaceae bacterium BRH_c20a]|nr:MAG: threonine dehydratase [Clostridiaceae bacterium BRH_c20a]